MKRQSKQTTTRCRECGEYHGALNPHPPPTAKLLKSAPTLAELEALGQQRLFPQSEVKQ